MPPRPRPDGPVLPTLFESALQTLMGRPFGWLIVADPTDLLDAEAADLADQLTVLRRYEQEHARSRQTGPSGGWPNWTPTGRLVCGTCACWRARPPSRTCG